MITIFSTRTTIVSRIYKKSIFSHLQAKHDRFKIKFSQNSKNIWKIDFSTWDSDFLVFMIQSAEQKKVSKKINPTLNLFSFPPLSLRFNAKQTMKLESK